MVRIRYDESKRTGVLSSSAEAYIKAVASEALQEDPRIDCNQLARVLAGELEETGATSSEDPNDIFLDVKSVVYITRSKLRNILK